MKIILAILAFLAPSLSAAEVAHPVKKSSSGICHDVSSPYYEKTKNFTIYGTMEYCIESGGRAPKSYTGAGAQASSQPKAPPSNYAARPSIPDYDRSLFPHWSDEDGDGIDMRHEILISMNVGNLKMRNGYKGRRYVDRGRWNDPYTGKHYTDPGDLDIDHIVPLKWAWDHGAYNWDRATRKKFANAPANLLAVDKYENREKSAQGPDTWLPPNVEYRCQYVLRFHRIVSEYKLSYFPYEADAMNKLYQYYCEAK